MLTYPKSTLGVLRMLMHLSSGHVTLPVGEFHPPEIFPQLDLGRWADSHWALPQIFSWNNFIMCNVYLIFRICLILLAYIFDYSVSLVWLGSLTVLCRTSHWEVAGSTHGMLVVHLLWLNWDVRWTSWRLGKWLELTKYPMRCWRLFCILCPLSRCVFTCLRRSNGPSPMQSALYLYINNLSSKNTMQNKYSINVTFLDYEYNWIKSLINRHKEVFLVGWCWNRINWDVIRHLKSDRKIFVVKLS